MVNGGARRIVVKMAAGVLLAAWTLLADLGGVYAQPQPTPERWGVRPLAEEEPEYKEKVAQLERELHQVQARLNQTRNNLEALWGEWSVDDRTWAEHRFFANPQRYGGALGGGLSLAKEDWEVATRSYETALAGAGRVDLNDPLVGPEARDQLWSAHLRVLRRELAYFNTALGYENIRYIAIKEQQQYWFGEWNTFVNDAIDHIEYVYWSHVDAVMTELFNCMAKSTANVARNALLNQWGPYRAYMRVDQPIPDPIYSAPAGTPNGWNVVWTQDPVKDRVPLGDAFFLDCIRDGFRAGLVSAVVSGMRKSFVDRVARRDNVDPQIAEYWWSRFIWDGPIEDPYTHLMLDLGSGSGRPNYVQRKLEDAFWKNWGTGQPYKEQAIEQLKELIGARQSGKLAPVYKEATDAAKAAYDDAVRRGAIRPERMADLKRVSDKAANDIYKRKAPGIGAKAAVEVAENVITIGFQAEAAIEILWKEFSFEQQEQVLVKTHNEILQCLTKMEMSTGPSQIIAIYELGSKGRDGIDNFFRQCREPSRAQREKVLEQLKDIDRQIGLLLDQASGQATLARDQCDAALSACSAATRSYNATADNADRVKTARAAAEARLAMLQARVAGLEQQAEQAAQAGQAMGQAMVGAEQAALAACEVLKAFPGLKTEAERQGQLASMRASAARCGSQQKICRERGEALRNLAAQVRGGAAAVAAEVDALVASTGDVAGGAASGDADLERCRGSLGAARNAAKALPGLEQEARQLHAQGETIAKPMRGSREIEAQMDTLWRHVEPITVFARGPGDCLPRATQQLAAAEAAHERAQQALGGAGQTPRALGNPAALKQAAEAAARKAESASALADDYRGRADVAAADAQNCVVVAEDFARKAAAAASTTGATSSAAVPGAQSGEHGVNADETAQLAAECATRFPGSIPAWDANNNRGACRCPDGAAPNGAGNACISCGATEANFAAAFNAGDFGAAQGWLAEGARCSWAGRAQAALAGAQRQQQQADLNRQQRELDCLRLETNIMAALNARNLGAAQGLIAQAVAMGCVVSGQTQFAVQDAISRQQQMVRDQQQQQALAQFTQNWQRMLENMQRQSAPPPAQQPRPSAPPSGQAAWQAPQLPPQASGPQVPQRPPPGQATAPVPSSQKLGYYEPKGTGSSCAAAAGALDAQCTRMNKETERRKCELERGASGCALDGPGCGAGVIHGVLNEASCMLHASYFPSAQPIAQRYLQEVQGCVERFFADRQPGAFQRWYPCTRDAGDRALQAAGNLGVQSCEARCAQDGGRRNPKVTNFCNCERPGGRP